MSTQDKVPAIPRMNDAEVTFYQQLDLTKLQQEHEIELARIAADEKVALEKTRLQAEVDLKRAGARQQMVNVLTGSVIPWLGAVLAVLIAAGVITFAVWGIYQMATSGPPKSVEQIKVEKKHDRFKKCVVRNGEDDGDHDNIWYPTAQGGDGLCLPKDKPAPTTP